MSGILNLPQVQDYHARETLHQLNTRLSALETQVQPTRVLVTLTSPLNAGGQVITGVPTPTGGTHLCNLETLSGRLNAAVGTFLKRFQGNITPSTP